MTKFVLLGFTLIMIALALLVGSNAFRMFSVEDNAKESIVEAIIVWWGVGCLTIATLMEYRSHPKELLLLFGALAISLVVIEILLRVFLLFPSKTLPREYPLASKQYHHVLPANKRMHAWTTHWRSYSISTNEDGFRTKYSRAEFLRFAHRIVILGDSYTYGLASGTTFPEKMEEFLRKELQSNDVAVLNAGLTSYSPVLERAVYQGKVRWYAPHLVILMLDATDIGDDIIYLRQAHREGDSVWFDHETSDTQSYYGALWTWLVPPLVLPFTVLFDEKSPSAEGGQKRNRYYEFDLEIDGMTETNRFFIFRHSLVKTRGYFAETLSIINSLAADVERDGGLFLLVVPPRYHHWSERECLNDWGRVWYSRNDPFQFEYLNYFDSVKDSVTYEILNMLPYFKATDKYPLVFDNDPHWNEQGQSFVARTLTEYILERGLLR